MPLELGYFVRPMMGRNNEAVRCSEAIRFESGLTCPDPDSLVALFFKVKD